MAEQMTLFDFMDAFDTNVVCEEKLTVAGKRAGLLRVIERRAGGYAYEVVGLDGTLLDADGDFTKESTAYGRGYYEAAQILKYPTEE